MNYIIAAIAVVVSLIVIFRKTEGQPVVIDGSPKYYKREPAFVTTPPAPVPSHEQSIIMPVTPPAPVVHHPPPAPVVHHPPPAPVVHHPPPAPVVHHPPPAPVSEITIAGNRVKLSGDFGNPAGYQHATVVAPDGSGHGFTWGRWDPTVDHTAVVHILESRIRANPNDHVAVGQLAVMTQLGLIGT